MVDLCRGLVGGVCSSSSSDSHGAKEQFSEDAIICHSKLVSPGAAENSDGSKISLWMW